MRQYQWLGQTILGLSFIPFLVHGTIAEEEVIKFGPNKNTDWMPRSAGFKDKTELSSNTLDDIKYYACSAARTKRLKKAAVDQAAAAGFLRDVLYSEEGNENTRAMLDYAFAGAFTKPQNRTDNIRHVRKIFDLTTQGLTINPAKASEAASTRIVCLNRDVAKEWYPPQVLDSEMMAVATPSLALLEFLPHFFEQMNTPSRNLKLGDLCPGKTFTKDLASALMMSHELSHFAGIYPNPHWFIEELRLPKLPTLPPAISIYNPQNFGYAVALHLAGCADVMFKKPQQYDDGSATELRKGRKLLFNMIFPQGDQWNTTDPTRYDSSPITEMMKTVDGDAKALLDKADVGKSSDSAA